MPEVAFELEAQAGLDAGHRLGDGVGAAIEVLEPGGGDGGSGGAPPLEQPAGAREVGGQRRRASSRARAPRRRRASREGDRPFDHHRDRQHRERDQHPEDPLRAEQREAEDPLGQVHSRSVSLADEKRYHDWSNQRVDQDRGVGARGEREAEADGSLGAGRDLERRVGRLEQHRAARARQLASGAREVFAGGADGGDRRVVERARGRVGRRLDLAPAGQRPGGDHLAAVDAGLVDRRIARDEEAAAVGLLQHVAATHLGERTPRRPQLERAVEDRRLQRREEQAALPFVALASLAAQDRQSRGRVVAALAEALRAEPVGNAGADQRRRTARPAPRARRPRRRR